MRTGALGTVSGCVRTHLDNFGHIWLVVLLCVCSGSQAKMLEMAPEEKENLKEKLQKEQQICVW